MSDKLIPTPRTDRIMENIAISMRADTREQSIAHFEEANREIEQLERDHDLWKAEAERWRKISNADVVSLIEQRDTMAKALAPYVAGFVMPAEAKKAREALAAVKS